jgi:class 3 adenylate cyclase
VAEAAGPGEVLVSRTVRDLVAGSGIAFDDRGVRSFDGVPESWELFAVVR